MQISSCNLFSTSDVFCKCFTFLGASSLLYQVNLVEERLDGYERRKGQDKAVEGHEGTDCCREVAAMAVANGSKQSRLGC